MCIFYDSKVKNEKYKSRLQFCICLFEFYEVLNSFYKYYIQKEPRQQQQQRCSFGKSCILVYVRVHTYNNLNM